MFGRKDAITCPLMRGPCIEARCAWWTQVRGKHPQTGVDIDMHDCAVKWLPVLLIETSKETRQAAAAVESLRNESVSASQQVAGAILHLAQPHPTSLPNPLEDLP